MLELMATLVCVAFESSKVEIDMSIFRLAKFVCVICFALCLLIASSMVTGQTASDRPGPDNDESVSQEAKAKAKEVVKLQGVLNPIERLRLATRDPGIVEKICVAVGDTIEAGDTIAILDRKLFQAEVNAATNEFAAANEQAKNETDLEFARISYAVNQKVFQRSEAARKQFAKSVSKTELERLRLESERTRLSGVQAQQQRKINELTASLQKDRLQIAALRLENRTIKSKIGGTIVEIFNTPGEFVNSGQPIARILNLKRLRVVCAGRLNKLDPEQIPESAVFKIQKGDQEESFPAKITFVSPEIDPVRQTYTIWAEIENPNGELKSGLVGRLEFSK